MKSKLAVAFLVTWKVSGTNAVPCAKDAPAPLAELGFCTQSFSFPRSVQLDSRIAAQTMVKDLKLFSMDGIKISDVHTYSEEGAK